MRDAICVYANKTERYELAVGNHRVCGQIVSAPLLR